MIHICEDCAHIGTPRRYARGSRRTELLLWLCLLLPGLAYSFWRLLTRHWACERCHSGRLIPIDTPTGRDLLGRPQPVAGTREQPRRPRTPQPEAPAAK